MSVDVYEFESVRPRLMSIAYRMLGSAAEAEDVVGDVAVRWAATDREAVRVPEAWLVTVTTRRALDVLRSARLQREAYPGVWLPEPIATADEPGDELERLETLTMGFLVLLERLTPIERAVFVLHEALDYPYATIAEAVGRSEQACRQALHRARHHVTVPRHRTAADRAHAEQVAQRFMVAGLSGDVDELMATLSPDIVVTSDGGGIVHAAIRPITGPSRAARFLGNLAGRMGDDPLVLPCRLNDDPGALMHVPDGWVAIALEIDGERITHLRVVVNPAKLARLVESFAGATSGRPGPWDTSARFRHRGGQPLP